MKGKKMHFKCEIASRKEVESWKQKFGVFNSGPHLCVELDEGKHHTITVRTKYGKRITFAFLNWNSEQDGHVECVDIQSHDGPKNEGGIPLQKVAVRGQGPLFYSSQTTSDPATLTIVDLRRE